MAPESPSNTPTSKLKTTLKYLSLATVLLALSLPFVEFFWVKRIDLNNTPEIKKFFPKLGNLAAFLPEQQLISQHYNQQLTNDARFGFNQYQLTLTRKPEAQSNPKASLNQIRMTLAKHTLKPEQQLFSAIQWHARKHFLHQQGFKTNPSQFKSKTTETRSLTLTKSNQIVGQLIQLQSNNTVMTIELHGTYCLDQTVLQTLFNRKLEKFAQADTQ